MQLSCGDGNSSSDSSGEARAAAGERLFGKMWETRALPCAVFSVTNGLTHSNPPSPPCFADAKVTAAQTCCLGSGLCWAGAEQSQLPVSSRWLCPLELAANRDPLGCEREQPGQPPAKLSKLFKTKFSLLPDEWN